MKAVAIVFAAIIISCNILTAQSERSDDSSGSLPSTPSHQTAQKIPEGSVPATQVTNPDDIYWSDDFGLSRFNQQIYCSQQYGDSLFVGGEFTLIGLGPIKHLAIWNGNAWYSAGDPDGAILAMTIYNGMLVIAGDFTSVNGLPTGNIAIWDGNQWNYAGGLGADANIWALTVYNGDLIAAGSFTSISGVPANRIARWDGVNWSALGSGINDVVFSLTVYDNELIAGGTFDIAGGVFSSAIAKWNGVSWSALSSGMNGPIYALAVFNSQLIAGGYFTIAGGNSALNIAQWSGSTWANLSGGTEIGVNAMMVYDGKLITDGFWARHCDPCIDSIALGTWDGFNWNRLADFALKTGGIGYPSIFGLNVYKNELIVTGKFDVCMVPPSPPIPSDQVQSSNIVRWIGWQWKPLGAGVRTIPAGGVEDFTVWNGQLIMGGQFNYSSGLEDLQNLAVWQGTSWAPQGSNVGGKVFALTTFKLSDAGSVELIVGGDFNSVGGNINCHNIASYDGTRWLDLRTGTNGPVYAAAVYNNGLYIGGSFTMCGTNLASNLSRWNYNQAVWQSVPNNVLNGVNGTIYAMAVYGTDLIVGGDFTAAGAVSANNIARWNGTSWHSMYGGMDGPVYALTVYNGKIIAGGSFTHAGSFISKHVAQWDGSAWTAIGFGIDGIVLSLKPYGQNLLAGYNVLPCISEWNGTSWSPLGSGILSSPNTQFISAIFADLPDSLFVGGMFERIGDNKEDFDVALWTKPLTCCVKPGDANNNGTFNVLDITYVINFLYRHATAPVCRSQADVNANGAINVLDVTYMINAMYKGGPICTCGTID